MTRGEAVSAGAKALLNQTGALKRGAQAFFEHQAAGGIVLMAAACLALVLDNSPFAWAYDRLLGTPVVVQIGDLVLAEHLKHQGVERYFTQKDCYRQNNEHPMRNV